MSQTIHLTFESNDLSEFDTTSTDGGKLSTSAGAAMVGSYGLQALIDSTNDKYGQKDAPAAVANLRYRLYFDPNSISMPDASFVYFIIQYNTSSQQIALMRLYRSGSNYLIYIASKNDSNITVLNDNATITDAPHYIEVYHVRATNSSSADGTVEWWIDGVSQGSASSIDNYNLLADAAARFRIGALSTSSASISGTIYIDDFIVNNDGSAIGPAVTATPVPVFMNQYRQRRA